MADVDRCTACNEPIRWTLTVGGRRMPLNPEPHADGNVVPVRAADGTIQARVLTGSELPALEPAWRSHFVTCPFSADFRRRQALAVPKCAGCRLPLDRVWAAAGHLYHVLCQPEGDLRDRAKTIKKETTS